MADGAEQFGLAGSGGSAASDLCDPIAFEARLAEARARRAAALAASAPARSAEPTAIPVLTAPPDQRPREPAARRPGLLRPVLLAGLVVAAGAAAVLTLAPLARAPAPAANAVAPVLAGLPAPVALPAPAPAQAAVANAPLPHLQIAAGPDLLHASLLQAAIVPPHAFPRPLTAGVVSKARTEPQETAATSPFLDTAGRDPGARPPDPHRRSRPHDARGRISAPSERSPDPRAQRPGAAGRPAGRSDPGCARPCKQAALQLGEARQAVPRRVRGASRPRRGPLTAETRAARSGPASLCWQRSANWAIIAVLCPSDPTGRPSGGQRCERDRRPYRRGEWIWRRTGSPHERRTKEHLRN